MRSRSFGGVHPSEHLDGIGPPAVFVAVDLQKRLQVGAGESQLAQDVFRHAGVIQCHVVVGCVLYHQSHDGPGRLIVAGISDRVSNVEDDVGSQPPVACAEFIDGFSSPLDLSGERVARRAVACSFGGGGWWALLLADFDLDRVAEWLDLRKPGAGRSLVRRCG